MVDFSELIVKAFKAKYYEPMESGRELSVREYQRYKAAPIRHRFEFKGGVALGDIIAKNITQNNALLKRLKSK